MAVWYRNAWWNFLPMVGIELKLQYPQTDLHGLLHVLAVVLLNVMVGADGVLEFIVHHHAGTLGAWPSKKHHDTCSCVGEGTLPQTQVVQVKKQA